MSDKSIDINVAPKGVVTSTTPEWHSDASYDGTLEKQIEKGTTVQLKRRLQSRHLQMIAIGTQDA